MDTGALTQLEHIIVSLLRLAATTNIVEASVTVPHKVFAVKVETNLRRLTVEVIDIP